MFTIQRANAPVWEIEVVDPADIRITAQPRYGQTVTGYGSGIPTQYMIRVAGRWYRVKVDCYGNAGSSYVTVAGIRRAVVERCGGKLSPQFIRNFYAD